MKLEPYSRIAQYYETDQMGVVHHSNYIRWFEEARVDALIQCGLSYKRMEEMGVMSPLRSVSCTYVRPVRFEDRVLVELRIEDFVSTHGLKFVTKYRITNADTGEVVTTGETSHCITDMNIKLVRCERVAPAVYEAFKALEELSDVASATAT